MLQQEEGGVLLGFSSDGNFLIYSVWRGSLDEIQWKRVGFQDFQRSTEDGEALETVFTLCVGGATSLYGVNAPLQVWQSVDHALVLAITTDRLAEDRETPGLCRVAVAPSPVFDNGGDATAVTSLSFRFTRHASAQKMEPWQLMQFVSGLDTPQNVYHLLVNAGTSRFLGSFLETFKPLRHYNLVDYDLRLIRVIVRPRRLAVWLPSSLTLTPPVDSFVQASTIEKTVFLTYVVALVPSLTPSKTEHSRDEASRCQLRVALFFSLELFTGVHHIIRALKVPGKESLRHISQVVARRFLADLNARLPHEPTAMRWNNDALLREESLRVLHNPVYPLSISLD
ncbi:hypothetical protein BBJ28_00008495 [Nothophytophthora sp. Chile5]|nr:hypothetical protein BBJ28_00008495 [Nothophytophthora sp. Chile5]